MVLKLKMNWTRVLRRNKHYIRLRVLILLCVCGVCFNLFYNNYNLVDPSLNSVNSVPRTWITTTTPDGEKLRAERVVEVNSTNVLVLIWTTFYGKGLHYLGIQNESYPDCFRHCEITDDRSKLDQADAVIFNAWDLYKQDVPKTRDNGQFWVMLDGEVPLLTGSQWGLFPGIFNWTMTYRMDSDVFLPFGEIEEIPESIRNESKVRTEIDILISGKTKLVAGAMSKCYTLSNRETLISQLKAYIPVDIYGTCGIPVCERDAKHCNESAFWKDLSLQYKFFLAFENALCVDYVTEKLFRPLKLGMVPVVYGGVIYREVAPPHSFIDVSDFKSPWELANFLTKLDKNETEYRKYFEWKVKYRVKAPTGFCNLCKKLQRIGLEKLEGTLPVSRTYHYLHTWWSYYPPPTESLPSETKIGKSNITLSPSCKNARYY